MEYGYPWQASSCRQHAQRTLRQQQDEQDRQSGDRIEQAAVRAIIAIRTGRHGSSRRRVVVCGWHRHREHRHRGGRHRGHRLHAWHRARRIGRCMGRRDHASDRRHARQQQRCEHRQTPHCLLDGSRAHRVILTGDDERPASERVASFAIRARTWGVGIGGQTNGNACRSRRFRNRRCIVQWCQWSPPLWPPLWVPPLPFQWPLPPCQPPAPR